MNMKENEKVESVSEALESKAASTIESRLLIMVLSNIFSQMSGEVIRAITEKEADILSNSLRSSMSHKLGEDREILDFLAEMLHFPKIEDVHRKAMKTATDNVIKQLCKLGLEYDTIMEELKKLTKPQF